MGQEAKISISPARRPPGRLPSRSQLAGSPRHGSPWLLGKLLVCRADGPARQKTAWLAGRIVEVEAYLGPHNIPPDPAAHSHRGPTPRIAVLYGPPAHAYVYAIYGRYFCMNITCEPPGQPGCILVRALEPLAGLALMAANRGLAPDAPPRSLTSGPSRLCQALGLTRPLHNGLDLLDPHSPLQLRDDGYTVTEAIVSPRIGIRHAVDLPLRFTLPDHACVSGPRKFIGKRVLLG
jgi:DNA-3-methyladenine glycosylase